MIVVNIHRDAMKQEIVSYNDVGFKDNSLRHTTPHTCIMYKPPCVGMSLFV